MNRCIRGRRGAARVSRDRTDGAARRTRAVRDALHRDHRRRRRGDQGRHDLRRRRLDGAVPHRVRGALSRRVRGVRRRRGADRGLVADRVRRGQGIEDAHRPQSLGVNAHVNHDLAHALFTIGIGSGDTRAMRQRDHFRVNDILHANVETALTKLGALYAPGLAEAPSAVMTPQRRLFSGVGASSLGRRRRADRYELDPPGTASRTRSKAPTVIADAILVPSIDPAIDAKLHAIEQGSGRRPGHRDLAGQAPWRLGSEPPLNDVAPLSPSPLARLSRPSANFVEARRRAERDPFVRALAIVSHRRLREGRDPFGEGLLAARASPLARRGWRGRS